MNIKLLIVLCFSTQIYASGFNDNDGAPIRQGVHIEWYRTIAPGYSGEGIFVWSDTRYGMRNIFAHKIDQDGNLLWGDEGTVVTMNLMSSKLAAAKSEFVIVEKLSNKTMSPAWIP